MKITNLFFNNIVQKLYLIPLLGLIIILIFIVPIINQKDKLKNITKQGIAFQLYSGVLLIFLVLIKYLQWFFINSDLIDTLIHWLIKLYLLVIYAILIYVLIKNKDFPIKNFLEKRFNKL